MCRTLNRIYNGHSELAEGPVWHENALWWVNITAGTLNRLDIDTGLNTSRAIGEYIGCAVPSPKRLGEWWIAGHQRILALDWINGQITTLHDFSDQPASIRFNDGKLDSKGRFRVGTLSLNGENNQCNLYRRSTTGEIKQVLNNVSLSNGIAWNSDESKMDHIDTHTRTISKFNYNSLSGSISQRQNRTTFQEQEGWPDGMCAGVENDLWVAMWGGKQVLRLSATDGSILERIPLPIEQPSSVCLVLREDSQASLAITTAWQGLNRSATLGPSKQGAIYLLDLN